MQVSHDLQVSHDSVSHDFDKTHDKYHMIFTWLLQWWPCPYSRSRWQRTLQWFGLRRRKERGEKEEGGGGEGEGEREGEADIERGFEILEYPESPQQRKKLSVTNPLAMVEEGSLDSKREEGEGEGEGEGDSIESGEMEELAMWVRELFSYIYVGEKKKPTLCVHVHVYVNIMS